MEKSRNIFSQVGANVKLRAKEVQTPAPSMQPLKQRTGVVPIVEKSVQQQKQAPVISAANKSSLEAKKEELTEKPKLKNNKIAIAIVVVVVVIVVILVLKNRR
jgi:hypothetical protein